MIVLPGDHISREEGFLRGHGSYVVHQDSNLEDMDEEQGSNIGSESELHSDVDMEDRQENSKAMADKRFIVSSVAGCVSHINRLIQVTPVQSKYTGEVGDVVVGRIVEVEQKRWKVDINGSHLSTLHLGAINLPGGKLRRRNFEDSLNMRSFFSEGDLVSAEIAKVSSEGKTNIHTRSLRYGKLENGVFVKVASGLVKRSKNHFISFSGDITVDAILGLNGSIWLSSRNQLVQQTRDTIEDTKMVNSMERKQKLHAKRILSKEERLLLARVRNVIVWLNFNSFSISQESIELNVRKTIKLRLEPKDILSRGGDMLKN